MSQKSQIRDRKKFFKYHPDDPVDVSEILPDEIGPVQAQDIPEESVSIKLVSISRRILFI